MARQSAGILLYRMTADGPELFLVHPGGPFWAKKDINSWSVPKGEFAEGEEPLSAARREFEEETGQPVNGDFIPLKPVKQKGGKTIFCYACEGNIDLSGIKSNYFEMEWPPRSGKKQSFPEVDKAGWFDTATARKKILESQIPLIDELLSKISNQS